MFLSKNICILVVLVILVENIFSYNHRAKHKPQRHRASFAYREDFLDEHAHAHVHELEQILKESESSEGVHVKHHIRHHHEVTPWPVKKEAVVEGDIVLGGLMMVHEREDSITCGPIMPQGGVQALESMLYTLDRLNNGDSTGTLLPEIKLGAHILDDCDKDTYGLEMAVDFIKGKICLLIAYYNAIYWIFINIELRNLFNELTPSIVELVDFTDNKINKYKYFDQINSVF